LFNVTGGNDLSLYEINQAASLIRETAHPDVNLIFGAVVDETMQDEIRITVIATGFERNTPPRQMMTSRPMERSQPTRSHAPAHAPAPAPQREPALVGVPTGQPVRESGQSRPSTFRPDDLEIPTFLRKRR
jgi:cell division protein FtsZ